MTIQEKKYIELTIKESAKITGGDGPTTPNDTTRPPNYATEEITFVVEELKFG